LISETYPSDLIGDYQIHNKTFDTFTRFKYNRMNKITPEYKIRFIKCDEKIPDFKEDGNN
jgi:hypothetical protein